MLKTHLPLALLASLALAGTVAAQAPDPATVQAGTYKADPNHSQIVFKLSHFGFTNFTGIFAGATGTLKLDPKSPAASSLSISVPIKTVTTTNEKLDGELKSPQWIDAEKYPDATFVSKKIDVTGKDTATVEGDFTLHGVTKPLTLAVTFVGAGQSPVTKKYTVGFEATGDIMRTEFGVKMYAPYVSDKVHLTISGAFEKAE